MKLLMRVAELITMTAIGFMGAFIVFFLVESTKPPAIEFRGQELLTPQVEAGGEFTIRRIYYKNEDCPGRWDIRWRREGENRATILDSGDLGTHPASVEFSFELTYSVPEELVPGDVFEVQEVDSFFCASGNSINRSGWLSIVVH